jgi:hypothetical protein
MYSKIAVEFLVFFTIAGAVMGASVAKKTTEAELMGKEFSVLQKVYDDCQEKEDFGGCLKGKALTAISRAVDQVSEIKIHRLESLQSFFSSSRNQSRCSMESAWSSPRTQSPTTLQSLPMLVLSAVSAKSTDLWSKTSKSF